MTDALSILARGTLRDAAEDVLQMDEIRAEPAKQFVFCQVHRKIVPLEKAHKDPQTGCYVCYVCDDCEVRPPEPKAPEADFSPENIAKKYHEVSKPPATPPDYKW